MKKIFSHCCEDGEQVKCWNCADKRACRSLWKKGVVVITEETDPNTYECLGQRKVECERNCKYLYLCRLKTNARHAVAILEETL